LPRDRHNISKSLFAKVLHGFLNSEQLCDAQSRPRRDCFPPAVARPIERVARRLLRREDGVAAVEFALVAAPFLALMFAIIETALVFFTRQCLETVVADSSRLIMAGQVQTARVGDGADTAFSVGCDARIIAVAPRRVTGSAGRSST
jgi:Flp pilus assembly pilin Flp